MPQTVSVSCHIRRAVEETGSFISDPHKLFAHLSNFSRCRFIEADDDGELWDVYMDSGTIYLGGRVLIKSVPGCLSWRSVRGTRNSFVASVEEEDGGSRLTLSLTFSASGLAIARISELIGRGFVARNLEAAAQEIRHHLEFEV
ncbi:MAG: SRPBCC family protein [Mycobacterium sp.]|nr:SRPBCC family protein [Mycobacterium sp.]